MGLVVLTLCYFSAPAIYREWASTYPAMGYLQLPIAAGLVVTALAFCFALYQALKLLKYIDQNKVFTNRSVRALRKISYSALLISACYAAGLPAIYHMATQEDAPGLMLLGLIFTCAPIVLAVFVAVGQRLLQNVIDIKSENDLTV